MTASHIIFIPAVLMVGMSLGFILGARAARTARRAAGSDKPAPPT